jgi:hypothetical protein
MGARIGRYLEGTVSMSSFMLLAVETACKVALRVDARFPPMPAVAVPMAAGDEPRRGREVEEVISLKVWEKEEKDVQ